MSTAKLILNGQEHEFPVVVGTEGEVSFDISALRSKSGAITLDPGYGNTGSCQSAITFIDGELGILRYRGYPIEQLAEKSDFTEVSNLVIYGELPTQAKLDAFRQEVAANSTIPDAIKQIMRAYPRDMHPMAILSAMIVSLCGFVDEGN